MAFHVSNPRASAATQTRFRRYRQREFVNELSKAFKEEMLKAVEKVPEDFDGIDLRLLARVIVDERLATQTDSARKRRFTRICNERGIP